MNKYIRALFIIPFSAIKVCNTKLFNLLSFYGSPICMISPHTEITIDGGKLYIGNKFKMRNGAVIRVRKNATCTIGNNTSVNINNIITCHESIRIGDNVQLSPNVQIYDHDHDFRDKDGIGTNKYHTSAVEIGNNVWIGANTVILRGTKIGDNCVIGAGSVIKGEYPANTVIIQERTERLRQIRK